MTVRAVAAAAVALGLLSCGAPDSRLSTTTFDGGKKLELFAAYSTNAASVTIQVFADVPDGTPGTLEVTGPFHMRCQGQFRTPDPTLSDPDNLPYLDIGTAGITPPSGTYTASAAIPSKGAQISKTFTAGGRDPAVFTAAELPSSCVPIADTVHQLQVMLVAYVAALQVWVTKLQDSTAKTQLLMLAAQATDAVANGDYAAALDDLTQVRNIDQALDPVSYAYSPFILRETLDSIALLTQASPPS